MSKPRNIAQIPDLPALAEVSDVLSAELGYQSLGKQLDRLAPLLKDESTEVCRRFFLWAGCLGREPVSYRWIPREVDENWYVRRVLFFIRMDVSM